MKTIIITSILLLMGSTLMAQATYQTNDPFANPSPLGYLGWNDVQNTDLDILQNKTLRVRLNSVNWTGYNISGGTTNASRVFMGINGNNMTTPFSMLHLGYNISTALRRDWMNVGTTYGASADFMHVGLMVSPKGAANNSIVDAVVGWGDNDDIYAPGSGPDNLRFLFFAPTFSNSPAKVAEGIETMRITPMGNVGIGDFSQMPNGIGATYGQPRARLDVQFRNQIPLNTDNIAINAYNGATDPTNPVSIEKIAVRGWTQATNYVGFAIGGRFTAERGDKTAGVYADVIGGGGGASFGVLGQAIYIDNDDQHFGVYGQARGGVHKNVGVFGEGYSTNGMFAAGIQGVSQQGSPNSWGGYFTGRTYCTLGVWSASDATIKEDITDVENATEMLLALQPKHYTFNQNIPQLVLDDQYHFGFLAQEMQAIVPELVRDMITPTQIDSSGNVIVESAQFKAVQYEGLIPILVAGFQEQNTTLSDQAAKIASQNQQIAQLEAQLESQTGQIEEIENQLDEMMQAVLTMQAKTASCCKCPPNNKPGLNPMNNSDGIKLEQNIPNPFDHQTRIEFYIPQTAMVILEITDAAGRPLERLIDARLNEGSHATRWDASGYAPGVYFYTLYADGQLLTRKMVKQ